MSGSAGIETLDNGKPVNDARFGDVAFSYELLRYMADWSTKITGQTIPLSSGAPFHAYTLRELVDVCGQIVPWNLSFMTAVWEVAPVLAAGCTVDLKPAKQTPLTALPIAVLVEGGDFPASVFNVITGFGETAGQHLLPIRTSTRSPLPIPLRWSQDTRGRSRQPQEGVTQVGR